MKTNVYFIQIWTQHDIIRAWIAADTPEESFEIVKSKYEDVLGASVIHEYDASDFPFYVCTLRGPVSSVTVYRYGYSDHGFILNESCNQIEIDDVPNFIARAVDRGAECMIERESLQEERLTK